MSHRPPSDSLHTVYFYRVEKSPYVLGAIVVAQLIGYLIYRASNYQKNEFRKNPLNPRASGEIGFFVSLDIIFYVS